MRTLRTLSCLALLAASAVPSLADSRYSCMASDERVKIAVRLEFSEELGGKLAHVSGALSATDAAMPPSLQKLRITSDMLTQQWVDKNSIRLRLLDYSDSSRPVYVAMGAEVSDSKAGRLRGKYVVEAPDGKEPGFRVEGALFCQVDKMASVALSDPF